MQRMRRGISQALGKRRAKENRQTNSLTDYISPPRHPRRSGSAQEKGYLEKSIRFGPRTTRYFVLKQGKLYFYR